MERRRFVRLAAASAGVGTAGVTGCLGGGEETDEDTSPDTADFGYSTWLPASDYRLVGYFDLAATRGLTTLSRDGSERSLVGDASVPYADIEAIMSTTGSDAFEAYAGGFDISAGDLLPEAETSERAGFTVASGTADGEAVEVAVADEGDAVVVARGGADASSVADAAVGDATRQADEGGVIPGLSEYADGEPLAVQFDYGVGNTVYQFFEERDDGVAFVEVAILPDEQAVEQTIDEDYNYSDGRLEDLNMTVRGEGNRLIIENLQSAEAVESAALGTNGLLP
mgnify:CR=1 FL=1